MGREWGHVCRVSSVQSMALLEGMIILNVDPRGTRDILFPDTRIVYKQVEDRHQSS